jgi:hypothetical protein
MPLQTLIEDYKTILAETEAAIPDADYHFTSILEIQASCYRTIISKLEKELSSITVSDRDVKLKAWESWMNYEYRETQNLYESCYEDGFTAGYTAATPSNLPSLESCMEKAKDMFFSDYKTFQGVWKLSHDQLQQLINFIQGKK